MGNSFSRKAPKVNNDTSKKNTEGNNNTIYLDLNMKDSSGFKQFGCDAKNHMAIRNGTEWSCRTCYEKPLKKLESGQESSVITYGYDVCNKCYPSVKHEHVLEQGWRA